MSTQSTKSKLFRIKSALNSIYSSIGSSPSVGLGDALSEIVDNIDISVNQSVGAAAGQNKVSRKEILTWSAADIINQYKDLKFVAANDSMSLESIGTNSGTSSRIMAVEGTDYTMNHQVPYLIDCVADVSGSLNNKYFRINAPANNYHVWFNVASAGVDPGVFVLACSSANATAGTLYNVGNYFFSVSATISGATSISLVGVPLYYGTGLPAASGVLNRVSSFTVSSNGSVVAGDTYTNNGQTFTVLSSITNFVGGATSTILHMIGTGSPAASGVLTLATGTGSATINFSAQTTGAGDASIAYSSILQLADPILYDLSSVASPSIAIPVAISTNDTATTVAAAVAAALKAVSSGSVFQAASSAARVTVGEIIFNIGFQAFVPPSANTSGFTISSLSYRESNSRISLKASGALAPGNATNSLGHIFTVTSANATVGTTYTNNSQTFTVLATISGGTTLYMAGTGNPTASGTLTKTGAGAGDATITYSAFVANTVTVAQYGASEEDITSWMGFNPLSRMKRVNVVYNTAGDVASFPYWSIGSGVPMIFFPRVFNDFRSIGSSTLRDWSERYQIIIPCIPDGFLGPIQGSQQLYQYSNQALFMVNFIKALGLGPAHLFSTTAGCLPLMRTAIMSPDSVRSIIMGSPTIGGGFKQAVASWVLTPNGSPQAAAVTSSNVAQDLLFTDMYNTMIALPGINGAFIAGQKNIASANGLYPGRTIDAFGTGVLAFVAQKQLLTDNALLNTMYLVANYFGGNVSYPQFPNQQYITLDEIRAMKTPMFAVRGTGSPTNFTVVSDMLAAELPAYVTLKNYTSTAPEPTGSTASFTVDVLNWLKDY